MNYARVLSSILLVTFWTSYSVCAAAAGKDAGHGKDYRTFNVDGSISYGEIGDSYTADLVMYLAGNQFMVMEELIQDFQSKNQGIAGTGRHPKCRPTHELLPPRAIWRAAAACHDCHGDSQ